MMMISDRPIRVACLGGGQLGQMMGFIAPRLNIEMYYLDPNGNECPAASIVPSNHIYHGSIQDTTMIQQFIQSVQPDIITTEIKHINCQVLYDIEQQQQQLQQLVSVSITTSTHRPIVVRPSSSVIRLIQDKYLQKVHFDQKHHIPVPKYIQCDTISDIHTAIRQLGLPIMLKTRHNAYDGRGNAKLEQSDDISIHNALLKLGVLSSSSADDDNQKDGGFMLYAEGWIHFDYEVAVMVVRSASSSASSTTSSSSSSTRCYPAVTAIQQDSICRMVLAPARYISSKVQEQIQSIAIQAIDSLPDGACGIFGVELFVTYNNRSTTTTDHNNDYDVTILLNEVAPRPHNTGHYTQDACYVCQFENHLRGICNLPLGNTSMKVPYAAMINILGSNVDMVTTLHSSNMALSQIDTCKIHWYGKKENRYGRKMGHINIVSDSIQELNQQLQLLMNMEKISDISISNLIFQNEQSTSSAIATTSTPIVGVIMGSHSDLPTMQDAIKILKQFHISYEVDIVSAHRTPDKLMDYSRTAYDRGIRIIIAGAGGAAHLPGMVAAITPVPVIGVPIKTSTLSGIDSLYSIVQMPKGVPVATVAIGNATNAGLLAIRMLSVHDHTLYEQMIQYQNTMKNDVIEISTKLGELGCDAYLEQMENKNTSVNV